MFSFPSTRTVAESAIAACLFGSSLGGMVSVVPLVTLDLVGVETYVSAFATLTSIRGVANIIAGPLAGKILLYYDWSVCLSVYATLM